MKKIVVDARMYGTKHTGIGRYVKNLLSEIKKLPDFSDYQWTLVVYQDQLDEVRKDLGDAFTYVPVNIRHYSLREQLELPWILYRLKPDLVHFTHFNKPVLYLGRSVVTIHDLIKHFSKGKETTTRAQGLYWLKYGLYRLTTRWVILTSNIIVPSNFWREYLIKAYHLPGLRVTTTYEAVDKKILKLGSVETKKKMENYIVYTGNLYPHKNVEVIFRALTKLPELSLKIICSRSVFSQRAEKKAKQMEIEKQVEFLGFLPDEEFLEIYRGAIALVHPSFLEGFSLTGLEAMALGCPVIAARSSCLPEIYENSVLYFDPKNEDELVELVNKLSTDTSLRKELINKGKEQVKKYSWSKTAKETIAVYKRIFK